MLMRSARLFWLLSGMLLGCGGMPSGEEVARVPSPNGRMEAIVTESDGGEGRQPRFPTTSM